MIQILKGEKKAFVINSVKHATPRRYNELRLSNILKSIGPNL